MLNNKTNFKIIKMIIELKIGIKFKISIIMTKIIKMIKVGISIRGTIMTIPILPIII